MKSKIAIALALMLSLESPIIAFAAENDQGNGQEYDQIVEIENAGGLDEVEAEDEEADNLIPSLEELIEKAPFEVDNEFALEDGIEPAYSDEIEAAGLKGLNCEYRSQQQIKSFVQGKEILFNEMSTYKDKYSSVPVYNTVPLSLGSLSTNCQNKTLNLYNLIRYVAGLDSGVTNSATYRELAQACALANAVNGSLSHTPKKPEAMSPAMYDLAVKGAAASNISSGYQNSMCTLIGYMWDRSSSTLGHRRWILDPATETTGFGHAGSYYAMYALGYTRNSNKYNSRNNLAVAWPARNMPVELMTTGCSNPDKYSYSWSLSLGKALSRSTTSVSLVRTRDKRTWTFDATSPSEDFIVNNSGYGQVGCIIFDPHLKASAYQAGDVFQVHVKTASDDISYNVEFFSVTETAMPFKDVPTNAWYYSAVKYCYDNRIMSGTSATTFEPNTVCSREMLVTILYNAIGKPVVTEENPFKDVEKDKWYTKAVTWAAKTGITNGRRKDWFGIGENVTREQVAQFLYNYAEYRGYDMSGGGDLSRFSDANKVSSWALTAMKWANNNGIINGKSGGKLDPQGAATRAEIAQMMMTFMKNFK